jgi:hypothetical protein
VAKQSRKQEKEIAVVDDRNSHAPPESVATQERNDEPVIVIVPAESKKMAPPCATAERLTKMQSTTDKQSAVEGILLP